LDELLLTEDTDLSEVIFLDSERSENIYLFDEFSEEQVFFDELFFNEFHESGTVYFEAVSDISGRTASEDNYATIIFNNNGNEGFIVPESFNIETPSTIFMPYITYEGFVGWVNPITVNVARPGEAVKISGTGNVYLYAIWEEDSLEFNSRSDVNFFRITAPTDDAHVPFQDLIVRWINLQGSRNRLALRNVTTNQLVISEHEVFGDSFAVRQASLRQGQRFRLFMSATIGSNSNGVIRYFTVQNAAAATLSLNPGTNWNPSAAVSTQTVTVLTNQGTWTARSSQPWLTLNRIEGANGQSFTLTAAANTGTTVRDAIVIVDAGAAPRRTIQVTQVPPAATLTLTPAGDWTPLANADLRNITVNTNQGTWTASSDQSWLRLDRASGTSGQVLPVRVTENDGTSARTGRVTVRAGTQTRIVTVTQAGRQQQDSLTIVPDGTWRIYSPGVITQEVQIITGSPTTMWDISVNSEASDWLSIIDISPANRTGNGRFIMRAEANLEDVVREGLVTITVGRGRNAGTGRSINVWQAGRLFLDIPVGWAVPYTGGERSVRVNTWGIPWTVHSNDPSWLTVTIQGGLDDGTFIIRATPLAANLPRRAARVIITAGTQERYIWVIQGRYMWPIEGSYVPNASERQYRNFFGATRTGGRLHAGIDIRPNLGVNIDPVLAFASGTIVRAGWVDGAGQAIVINTPTLMDANGTTHRWIQHRYTHLQESSLSLEGTTVTIGTQVARVGDTGSIDGNGHLHFELRTYRREMAPPGRPWDTATPIDPMVHFFTSASHPHIAQNWVRGARSLGVSDEGEFWGSCSFGELFVEDPTLGGLPYTVANLSTFTQEYIRSLEIPVETIQALVDSVGIDDVLYELQGLGLEHVGFTMQDGKVVELLEYDISIRNNDGSAIDDIIFPAAAIGYGTQTPHNIVVHNTGSRPTGALSVSLSGTDANSFTLSRSSVPSITISGTESFTVVPVTGLAAGTHTATITVSGERVPSQSFTVSFTVTQPETTLTISPDEDWHAPRNPTLRHITVTTNHPYWTAESDAPWLTTTIQSSISGYVLTIMPTLNNEPVVRTGTVTITAGNQTRQIVVHQYQAPAPTMSITPSHDYSIPITGATRRVTVLTNQPPWTVESNVEWITFNMLSGSSAQAFDFSVAENLGSTERVGIVTVRAGGLSRTFTVTQATTAEPTLEISPTSTWIINSDAATRDVSVESNRAVWGVSADGGWLTFDRNLGSLDDSFTMTASQNRGVNMRTTFVVVRSGTLSRFITVWQKAPIEQSTLTLNVPDTWGVHAAGAWPTNVLITTNRIFWTAESHVPWITLNANEGRTIGLTSDSLIITVADNPERVLRTGTVTVMAGNQMRTLTIVQHPATATRGLSFDDESSYEFLSVSDTNNELALFLQNHIVAQYISGVTLRELTDKWDVEAILTELQLLGHNNLDITIYFNEYVMSLSIPIGMLKEFIDEMGFDEFLIMLQDSWDVGVDFRTQADDVTIKLSVE